MSRPESPACVPAERPRAIAIVGPTATGKTGLAIAVAHELDGEIISLDSRQAYRGFEIGTAAPAADELQAVTHHGVGFLEPQDTYGAGRFARLAHVWMAEIEARGRVPILVGGTGFFLGALLRPIFREPPMEPDRRAALRRWLEERSIDELTDWVRRLDPGLSEHLERIDRQRAMRTLELALLTGRSQSEWFSFGEPEHRPLTVRCFALELPPDDHRERIERRIRAQLAGGWIGEVRDLRARGLHDSPAFDAVGYRDVLAHAEGEVSAEETLTRIVSATWAYARRQRTWFRHQLPTDTVRVDGLRPTAQLARDIVADWRRTRGGPGDAEAVRAGTGAA